MDIIFRRITNKPIGGKPGKCMKERQHDRGHCQPNTKLHKDDSNMLSC